MRAPSFPRQIMRPSQIRQKFFFCAKAATRKTRKGASFGAANRPVFECYRTYERIRPSEESGSQGTSADSFGKLMHRSQWIAPATAARVDRPEEYLMGDRSTNAAAAPVCCEEKKKKIAAGLLQSRTRTGDDGGPVIAPDR